MNSNEAYDQGYDAFYEGYGEEENPYQPGTDLNIQWDAGWNFAFDEEG